MIKLTLKTGHIVHTKELNIVIEIKLTKERAEHDAAILKQEQERVLDILNKGKDALGH